jgi:hypothetical protein
MRGLGEEHKQVVQALAQGDTLKAHRTLDGAKRYQLHPLDGTPPSIVPSAVIDHLLAQRLLTSNMKFPAAVYLLTERGVALAADLTAVQTLPVHPRAY